MFLHREKEVNLLNEDFDKPNSTINFIFGRRKVGKSSLLNEYSKDKKVLKLLAFETMFPILLKQMKSNIDIFFNNQENKEIIESLEDLIIFFSKQKINNKIVLVLEDIQELIKLQKDFLIDLYKYWNKYLSKLNIQLILTSSLLPNDFDNLAIAKKIDNQIKLKSLSFTTIKKLFPNVNKDEAMYLFCVYGTNPEYLKYYDIKKDFLLNIKDNFLNPKSFLYNEGINLIKKDLSDAATYFSILYAISIGNNKIGDIASCLNLKSSHLTRYVQKLLELMIIDKILPINENPLKSKFGRYEIEDNFLKFWFCYIYSNINSINSNNYYNILKFIREDFSKSLVTSAYKKQVFELLQHDTSKFFDYKPKKIASWWNNKDVEIDFIAYDSKTITFIDCKWRKTNSIETYYKVLEKKAKNFQTQLEKKYIIFSKK